MSHPLFLSVFSLLSVVSSLAPPAWAAEPMPLADVKTFMIQIQKLEVDGAIAKLAATKYDMLIIDDLHSAKGGENVDMGANVRTLRAGKPGRIVLAYLDIGAAENDRYYWQQDWKAPTARAAGYPEFILATNFRGWDDTYPTAFWDKRWQNILTSQAAGQDSALHRAMSAGFDGVLVDWIDSYNEPRVLAEAKRQGVDPAGKMVELVSRVRDEARRANPNALMVAMNGPYLAAKQPKFLEIIDGILVESTWFAGKGDVSWPSGDGGDIPNTATGQLSRQSRIVQYGAYLKAHRPVFTIDYCLKPENAANVYRESRAAGFVPLVTRSGLGGITTTPP
jgi:cysteinyl-tRNA synthetase